MNDHRVTFRLHNVKTQPNYAARLTMCISPGGSLDCNACLRGGARSQELIWFILVLYCLIKKFNRCGDAVTRNQLRADPALRIDANSAVGRGRGIGDDGHRDRDTDLKRNRE